MRSSGSVPARFAERTLEAYEARTPSQEKALAAAQRMATGELGNLVLVGPTGVGKTHLAAAIVRWIRRRDELHYEAAADAAERENAAAWPPLPALPEWCNVAEQIVAMRLEMDMPADDRDASWRALRLRHHKALVVLDDLGRERTSDWTGEAIYTLVNARYESSLPTLVTTNLSSRELAASPYWPIISRLAEDGVLVEISGPDRRLAR